MVRPSGDQTGPLSATCLADVSCLRFFPSTDTSHRLIVVLFASGSQVRRVNTIHVPSGDGVGSPSRSIDTMSYTENGCGLVRSGNLSPANVGSIIGSPRSIAPTRPAQLTEPSKSAARHTV